MIKNSELEHAKSLIDVVFGVLIALPLTEVLPPLANDIIVIPRLPLWTSLFLLISALLFTIFYWIEVRRFIDKQIKIDNLIGENVGLPVLRFLGSIVMFGFVAAALKFANDDRFRPFVIANFLIWIFDLLGNIKLRKQYTKERIDKLKPDAQQTPSEEYMWLNHRISSKKFIIYSFVNALFFGLVLASSYIILVTAAYKFVTALLILSLTLFRHLYWRPKLDNA